MPRLAHTNADDPVVQVIPWTIVGCVIHIEITQSGKLLVDGSLVEPVAQTRSSLAPLTISESTCVPLNPSII